MQREYYANSPRKKKSKIVIKDQKPKNMYYYDYYSAIWKFNGAYCYKVKFRRGTPYGILQTQEGTADSISDAFELMQSFREQANP
jgi:hypothetical protein